MPITQELNERLHASADYLDAHGLTQFRLRETDGRVCATGAVILCQPSTGDEQVIIAVQRHRGRAESWNDEPERTAEEVSASLRVDITDAELVATFGPQWEAIVGLTRRVTTLVQSDARTLVSYTTSLEQMRHIAAVDAITEASFASERSGMMHAAADAISPSGQDIFSRDIAREAKDTAKALVVRDLIGTHGFKQKHYDTLTMPWRTTYGIAHPDDRKFGDFE